MVPHSSDSDVPSDALSLQELIEQKKAKWQAEACDKCKNRIEGLQMALFGVIVISLGFILFRDEITKARVMIILLGFGVSCFGIYFMLTGQKLPEDPSSEAAEK